MIVRDENIFHSGVILVSGYDVKVWKQFILLYDIRLVLCIIISYLNAIALWVVMFRLAL